MISFQEFKGLAQEYTVVPLVRTMLADLHTPVSAYLTLRDSSAPSFLFESVEPDQKIGRYSFIGAQPIVLLRARGKKVQVKTGAGTTVRDADVFSVLAEMSAAYRQAPASATAGFMGGFVGYMGYDNVQHLEKISLAPPPESAEDDAILGLFASIVKFDHQRQVITIIHNILVKRETSLEEQYQSGCKTVEAIELRLRRPAVVAQTFSCDTASVETDGLTREDYCAAVCRAQRYITEGDIFQVVLSRRARLRFQGDLFAVYRSLRMVNPSPYLFYLDFGDTKLVGSSPEVLVRVLDGDVEVLPIAGTRRRGASEEEDVRLAQELMHDDKELAEHIMLVDLGRNDVGRVSEYGSVRVPVLKRVERYSHVMHIVSEVRGKLKSGATALDAFKACFPAGTVSGAPKVRAMEIIQELEVSRRGAYAGAVGYLGFNGSLDTCIAIRTVVAHRDMLTIQAGAGIVADSVPDSEYQETMNKAQALMDAVALASAGLNESATQSRGDVR